MLFTRSLWVRKDCMSEYYNYLYGNCPGNYIVMVNQQWLFSYFYCFFNTHLNKSIHYRANIINLPAKIGCRAKLSPTARLLDFDL